MQARQGIMDMMDIVPQSIVDEVYNYMLYLKTQSEKNTRNKAYLDKIQRGIDQCAVGKGLRRDIVEVDEDDE